LGLRALAGEVTVELFLELLLQIDESFLAHHLYLTGNALVEHALPLHGFWREATFAVLFVFAIWWLIYFVLVIVLVRFFLQAFRSCRAR
jgi:hypothetical protein